MSSAFDAIVNGTIFLILFSGFLLLVYVYLYLVSYDPIKLCFSNFWCTSCHFLHAKVRSSMNKDTFIQHYLAGSSWWNKLTSLVIKTSRLERNKSGMRGHLCLVLHLRENAFYCLPLNTMLAVAFHECTLTGWGNCLLFMVCWVSFSWICQYFSMSPKVNTRFYSVILYRVWH